jgi:hypothetical protein
VTATAWRLRSPTRRPLGVLAAFAVVATSIAAGTLLVSRPAVALLLVAAFAGVLLLVDARARIAFVVFGGLLLLQTQGGLDGKKLAFLAGVVVASAGAFLNVQKLRHTAAYALAQPLLAASRRSRGAGRRLASLRFPERSAGEGERTGCIVYGALAERKGIDLSPVPSRSPRHRFNITIAGEENTSFLPRLDELVGEMPRAGATGEVRARRHSETEGLYALARAECAVLPYPSHDGMSRVLLKAGLVGTPVVVHARGFLGYLVRRHGLGHAVDCRDAAALRRAILELAAGNGAPAYRENVLRFASRFSGEVFQRALVAAFRGDGGALTTGRTAQTEGRL